MLVLLKSPLKNVGCNGLYSYTNYFRASTLHKLWEIRLWNNLTFLYRDNPANLAHTIIGTTQDRVTKVHRVCRLGKTRNKVHYHDFASYYCESIRNPDLKMNTYLLEVWLITFSRFTDFYSILLKFNEKNDWQKIYEVNRNACCTLSYVSINIVDKLKTIFRLRVLIR